MSTLVYHTYTKLSNFSRFGRHLRRLDIKVYRDRFVIFIDRVAADFFGYVCRIIKKGLGSFQGFFSLYSLVAFISLFA